MKRFAILQLKNRHFQITSKDNMTAMRISVGCYVCLFGSAYAISCLYAAYAF